MRWKGWADMWALCRKLWLGNNRLQALPSSIARLPELQHLFLEGNQLTELPAELASLRQLQRIQVQDNPLTNVPPALRTLIGAEMQSA